MTEFDKKYLQQKKKQLIDSCLKCKGLDLTCNCYAQYFWEVAKIDAAIPLKYRNFTLTDISFPESQKVVTSINQYIQDLENHKEKGRGIYLWGNTGNAKTALASIILMEAIKKGYTVYFTDLIKCMDHITRGWNDEEVRCTFTSKILKSHFLVIDDVGKEYKSKTGFTEAHFDMIFRERANNLTPTILTSNLAPTDIATDYGRRLMSIFYEHSILIETTTVDYRKRVIQRQNEKAIQSKKSDIT